MNPTRVFCTDSTAISHSRRRWRWLGSQIALGLGLVVFAATAFAGAAQLTVDVGHPGHAVPRSLWGLFFEEINCAGDGGLYAELVRNRSFEDADKPEHWSLLTTTGGQGEIALDQSLPMSPKNLKSLKVTATATAKGPVAVANDGYWGIAVRKGESYRLSLYARATGAVGLVTACLEGANGQVYAQKRLKAPGAKWQQYEANLKATDTDPHARLVLSIAQPGTVWFDMVSLFPAKTWKGRANGLRPDLAQKLADLNPAFVRFPGGCWVEGDTMEFAYRWKQTVGDLGDRRTQWNIWRYQSTQGLGFHEYLQMCEDLHAEPLFVINCGMSHREVVPLDKMGEFVQDALDAIEYANGPATSQWGALRAKNGHPAPFNLKFMEIGNENGGPAYLERWALFRDAIKARYPEMKLISNVWADFPANRRPDIVDEHYYSSPEFFSSNATKYDTYDRNGPKVYVGEYAVTAGCGLGNLRAAVGEAAFMTGLERNSDVVVMASYAPLFVNVNHRGWNPDLINFDGSRAYGTPAFYNQQLFALNRPDVVLPVAVQQPPAQAIAIKHGGVGLGTWSTQAEYKDLRVTKGDQVLYAADFARGLDGWKPFAGKWEVKDGALQQTDRGTDRRITVGDPAWRDYTLSVKARKLGGAEGFLIMFGAQDDANWFWWNLGGWGNGRHAIERMADGGKATIGNDVAGSIETGRWYDIRVELKDSNIKCYLDGKLIHDVTIESPQPLYAVAGQMQKSGEIVLKVVNTSHQPCDTELNLEGAGRLARAGNLTVLTSASPLDENSLDAPKKVAPVESPLRVPGPKFQHTFPACSVSVLRLPVEK